MRCTHDNWVVPLTTLFLVYLSAAPEGKQCTVGKLTTLARSLAMFVCGGSKSRAFKSPQGPGPLPASQAGSEAAAHHQGHRGDRGSSLRLLSHLFESELKSCISQASCYEPLPTGLNLLQRVGSPQRMAMRVL